MISYNLQFQQRWWAVPGNTPSTVSHLSLVQARGEPSPVLCLSVLSTLPPSQLLVATQCMTNICEGAWEKGLIGSHNQI